ncbi:MAG: ABC transporter ATP-binding protein [Alphaproteobacteria bacterium]|nr:ABC transporter ATP-binding protein [Alphaproteobacteria bacterium]
MSSVLDALHLERVSHRFGEIRAADGVSLTVRPGEVVCLLGPSGCGKTTVLRIAAGLERLQSGRVLIGGQVVADGTFDLPPEKRGVGLVFQDYALFPHLNVRDNVAFGLIDARDGEARRARVEEMLDQVGMAGAGDSWPHELSGGQQQRVALARALAPKPRLVLLDEPFSGLDSRLRDQVRDQTLHVLKQSGAATLMVTHDSEEAMFMADRIAVMRHGRIVQVGRPTDLYCQPDSAFVAGFFSEINVLNGIVKDKSVTTPFGALAAGSLGEGVAAAVLIRPEALGLAPVDEQGPEPACVARVLAARLLGRTSLVHLCMGDSGGAHLHLHARVPGQFLPAENDIVAVEMDRRQAFVFPAEECA